jgi:hypothetical protein
MDFRAILIHTLISNSKLSAIPGLPLALRPANLETEPTQPNSSLVYRTYDRLNRLFEAARFRVICAYTHPLIAAVKCDRMTLL